MTVFYHIYVYLKTCNLEKILFCFIICLLSKERNGGVAERLNAPVLKTGVPQGTRGSNPLASAQKRKEQHKKLFFLFLTRRLEGLMNLVLVFFVNSKTSRLRKILKKFRKEFFHFLYFKNNKSLSNI